MPIRENREYRNIPCFNIEKREAQEDKTYIVEGYASTFEEYMLYRDGDLEIYERIEPTAFDECDMSDVIFQKDHQGTVFARTSNDLIELSIDEKGLFTRTDLSKTTSSREMFEEIECGNYSQMSFAFTVSDDEIQRDSESRITRVIKSINKLYDVSAVSFPANPTTDISVATRSRIDGFIDEEKAELLKREEEQRKAQLEKEIALAKARFAFETVMKG